MGKILKLIKWILFRKEEAWYCPQCDTLNMPGRWCCGNCGYIPMNVTEEYK